MKKKIVHTIKLENRNAFFLVRLWLKENESRLNTVKCTPISLFAYSRGAQHFIIFIGVNGDFKTPFFVRWY